MASVEAMCDSKTQHKNGLYVCKWTTQLVSKKARKHEEKRIHTQITHPIVYGFWNHIPFSVEWIPKKEAAAAATETTAKITDSCNLNKVFSVSTVLPLHKQQQSSESQVYLWYYV